MSNHILSVCTMASSSYFYISTKEVGYNLDAWKTRATHYAGNPSSRKNIIHNKSTYNALSQKKTKTKKKQVKRQYNTPGEYISADPKP